MDISLAEFGIRIRLDSFFRAQLVECKTGETQLESGTVLSIGDGIANVFWMRTMSFWRDGRVRGWHTGLSP